MKKFLMVIAIAFVVVLLLGTSTKKEPADWTEYVVCSGDTVYDISIGITPITDDYRRTEYYIIQKNNVKNVLIYPGQTILIPVYE